MANVVYYGKDLGEITEPALAYYRREPGAVIDGVAVVVAEPDVETAEAVKPKRVLKKDLVAEAEALGLDSSGTVPELQARIADHVAQPAEPVEEQVAEQPDPVDGEPQVDAVDGVSEPQVEDLQPDEAEPEVTTDHVGY